jgi:hypothetical protein
MRIGFFIFLVWLVTGQNCVNHCELESACNKVQTWINGASDKELAGQPLGCADIDSSLVEGLSVVYAAGETCLLDWPTPDHLREFAQLRLQQSTSGSKAATTAIKMTVDEVRERVGAVLHCNIPIVCLPLCEQPQVVTVLQYVPPSCVPQCELNDACAKIQEWVDAASDKERAGQALSCADMDSRLTEGLSVMGSGDQCYIDFPTPDYLRGIRKLQRWLDQIKRAPYVTADPIGQLPVADVFVSPFVNAEPEAEKVDLAYQFLQKAKANSRNRVGIAINRETLIQRISDVLHCTIPVPCVPLCEAQQEVQEVQEPDVVEEPQQPQVLVLPVA